MPQWLLCVLLGCLGLGTAAGNVLDCTAKCSPGWENGEPVQKCEVDIDRDCDTDALWQRFEVLAPVALMLIALVWACVWPCLRCCGTAGSCAATDSGCCCPTTGGVDDEKRVQQAYFSKSLANPYNPCWAKYALPCVTVVLVCVAVWQGAEARGMVTDVTNSLIYGMRRETDGYFRPHEDNITTLLQRDGSYYTTEGGLDTRQVGEPVYDAHRTASREIDSVDADIQDARGSTVEEASDYALMLLGVPFVLCLLLLAFAGCGRNYSACGNGLAYVWIIITGLVLVVVWLFVAVMASWDVVSGDLCTEIDELRNPSATKGLVQAEVTDNMCPHLQATAKRLRDSGKAQSARLCQVLLPRCSDSTAYDPAAADLIYVCPASMQLGAKCGKVGGPQWNWPDTTDSTEMPSVEELRSIALKSGVPASMRGSCSATSCTLSECGTQCSGSAKTDSALATKIIDEGDNLAMYLVYDLEVLIDCNNMLNAVWRAARPPCDDLKDGVDQRYYNVLLTAVCLTVGMYAASLGVKRWIPQEDMQAAEIYPTEPADESAMKPVETVEAPPAPSKDNIGENGGSQASEMKEVEPTASPSKNVDENDISLV